jgi:hypothetical protein
MSDIVVGIACGFITFLTAAWTMYMGYWWGVGDGYAKAARRRECEWRSTHHTSTRAEDDNAQAAKEPKP